ncbi:MAG: aldo/keto reductase [Bacteroidota bacterium]
MQLKQLGRSGIFTTDICLGTMTFGDPRHKGTPKEEAIKITHRFLDAGGNHIDTANAYNHGRSEEILAEALKDRRSNVILATKVNFPIEDGPNNQGLSRYNIIKSTEASLRRLQTDYIDLLYMHCEDSITPIEESLRAFDDLIRDGKVRYIGVSNFKAWRLMKSLATSDAHNWTRFTAAQYQYSLVKRDIEHEFFDLFEEEGLSLLPWSPLGGGFLTGKYQRGPRPASGRISDHPDHTEEAWQRRNTDRNWAIVDAIGELAKKYEATHSQIAIAWTRQRPNVASVIIGARTMQQLEDNLKSTDIQLSEEDMQHLNQLSELPEAYPYRMIGAYGRKRP